MEEMLKQDVVAGPVAHVRKDGCCESVSTHLHEVADMAEHFADEMGLVGLGAYARAAGAYHDLGKYSDAFQERILRNGPKIDHSTAGAYELFSKGDWPLSYCIAGQFCPRFERLNLTYDQQSQN